LSWIFEIIWKLWGKDKVIREVKRKAVGVYIRSLRGVRRSILSVLIAFLCLQLMMLSAVGALVTGFYLWDHDFQEKITILFWVFAGTFAVPAMLLAVVMSEALWLRISGARRMMEDLRR
jgi:hypothetical protein